MNESHCLSWKENKLFTVLGAAVLIALVGFLVVKTLFIFEQKKHIGRDPVTQPTISVDGTGKVVAIPNVATIHVGLISEGKDVAGVQEENTRKMNALINALKSFKIDDEDIQTSNYNIRPRYNYERGGREIDGYSVNQNVEITVRDLKDVGKIFGRVGQIGANQVSGPNFKIDDPSQLQTEARKEAIKDAQEKAQTLAKELGVSLGRVVGYRESSGGRPPIAFADRAMEAIGGSEVPSPEIEPGSLDVSSTISIEFEIL